MCTKFEVDWTSTSSKTTLTKNFNLNERTNGRTDGRTHRPENIMPLYYRRWVIKIRRCVIIANVTTIRQSSNDE